MMKRVLSFLVTVFACALLYGQSQLGELRGRVLDNETKKPIELADVVVFQGGSLVGSTSADEGGYYLLKGLRPGKYNVKASIVGYHPTQVKDVVITPDASTILDLLMIDASTMDGIIVYKPYRPPLIPFGKLGTTLDRIINMPSRNIPALSNSVAGVYSVDGGPVSIRGSRPGATAYYIDGVRVVSGGNINFPQTGISMIDVITGGVSAEYGDFVGGVINVTSQSPASEFHASIEAITSSLFDKYHYNQLEVSLTGPMILKNKGRSTQRTILGYSFAGNFNYQADRDPSILDVYRVREDVLKDLEQQPLRKSPTGQGYVPSAEFITNAQLEKVQANQNVPQYWVSTIGNLNFTPGEKMQLVLGLKYDYTNAINYNYQNNLFNTNNNSQSTQHNVLAYLSFRQNLVSKEHAKAVGNKLVKSAYYTIRAEYQSVWNLLQDQVHKDNLFDYGHIGRFKTYYAPSYTFKGKNDGEQPDSVFYNNRWHYVKNYYVQTGNRPVDTLVVFDRSNTHNPIRANYTSQYFEMEDRVSSISQIRGSGGGLVNGQNPIGIYSNMWNNVGAISATYAKSQTEQYSLNASTEITIGGKNIKGKEGKGDHSIKFGIYYEQRVFRNYSVTGADGSGANGLWTLMYQLANNGLQLDTANPQMVFDESGIFRDTIRYAYKQSADQSTFDKNLRARLQERGKTDIYGNAINNTSYLDIHSLDPGDLSLDMFSADELLNNGNQYINYYGYDYLGNKIRGKKDLSAFLNDPQNRSVGAYNPIYTAAYIQDKFYFKDLIFRLGLRVERFDNNLPVLKDPYSLYPIKTAGEVKEMNGNAVTHPGGIGSDYAVYVNNAKNPTSIIGYRHENTWYNKNGIQIADPSSLQDLSNTGILYPYLEDPNHEVVTAQSFKDYAPVINVLPRVWFDFPIAEETRFFASYDVIAQRPAQALATISDYYFLRFNPTGILNNPNLKSQLTSDYELGFSQRLTMHSAVSLVASYREQRNLIQLYRYNFAYPVSYTSFGNIDFSTIKSFRVEYKLRDLHFLNIDASYMLQYADGTGSSAGSQQALVSAGQPNLRNLFPLDVDVRHNLKLNIFYDLAGDEYKGAKIFKDAGIGLQLNAFSGTPYTSNLTATPDVQSGQVVRSQIKGTPYGSRLPWQIQNSINIYKTKQVKLGRNPKDKNQPRMGQLRFMIWAENFLNVKNIRTVHAFTGSPSTDGWLESPVGKETISNATSAQSYVDLYNIALNNPGYYGLPRRIRLSVTLQF